MQVAVPAVIQFIGLKKKERIISLLDQILVLHTRVGSLSGLAVCVKQVFKEVLNCEKINMFTADKKSQVRFV